MHITLTYDHLTHHIVPGPQSLSYFIPLISLPLALLIPRHVLSKWQNIVIFIPLMTLASLHAWSKIGGVDVISVDVLLWALYLLIWRDPWRDFAYFRTTVQYLECQGVDAGGYLCLAGNDDAHGTDPSVGQYGSVGTYDCSQRGQDEQHSYPSSFSARVPWVLTLLASIRLGNWKIGHPSHDRLQPCLTPTKRSSFVLQSFLSIARGYLVLDLTRAYISSDPYFTDLTVSISSPLPFAYLVLIPPWFLRSAIVGAQGWAIISQMSYLPCLLAVGLNAIGLLPNEWSPNNWPPVFGPFRVVLLYGIRGFWSEYWHQSMRALISEPGHAIAGLLGLKRGGILRYAVTTATAFGLSGVIHTGLVPPRPLHATIGVNAIRLHIAAFFWAQTLAIMFEIFALRVLSRSIRVQNWQQGKGLRCRELANILWFIAWFTLCLPLFGEAARQLGYWRIWPMPISLWMGLRGEGWLTWSFLTEST